MNRLQVGVLLLAAVTAASAGATVPRTSASAATAPGWKSIGDATSAFSTAVMRGDQARAGQYLTDRLRKGAGTSSIHRMLGIQGTPHRYWYWVSKFDGEHAHVSLTHYFPGGRKPVTNHLEWVKVGNRWQISNIVRGTAPVSAPAWKTLETSPRS